jgi:hemoglobin-like flavoprotein
MTISSYQKTLVQSSFAQVIPVADQAARHFYDRLFELDPALRELFASDMADQRAKLMQMLHTAVRGLDRLEQLVPALQHLAIRHVGYQVRNEHYVTVGAALLWTLEQGLGDAYTADVRDAWVAVYNLISSVMMEAAGQAMEPAGAI